MESPQLENGYIKIANELIDALARTPLNTQETRVVFAILRKTYGYNKKEDWISNSQLELITGIHRSHCAHTVTKLLSRKIVAKIGNKISLNKMYNSWVTVLPKQATKQAMLPKQAQGVAQTGNWVLPKQAHTKDKHTKDNIQKKEFDLFWAAYPIKKSKGAAIIAFNKLDVPIDILLNAVETQRKEKEALVIVGQFCPEWKYPSTWLNQKCWLDEVVKIKEKDMSFYLKEYESMGNNATAFIQKYGKDLLLKLKQTYQ